MQLHPSAKSAIKAHLELGLPHVVVKNGMFIDHLSAFVCFYKANEAVPKTGKVHGALIEQVGEYPLIEFCTDTISAELRACEYITGDVSCRLVEMEGYADVSALADRLLTAFESLPWSYSLALRLEPSVLPPLPNDATMLPVTEEANLVQSSLLLHEQFPLDTPDEATKRRIFGGGGLLSPFPAEPKWEEGSVYFQVSTEGFIGPYGGGAPIDGVNRHLKSFFGLGLALRLFSYTYKYEPYPIKMSWWVHRREGERWRIERKLDLNDDDSKVLRSISLWDKFKKEYPEAHRTPWLQSVLVRVGAALKSEESDTLKLASQWFFDSFKGQDEVLTYVRRMTCLEILFGERADTSKASLGELIGNRIAYLIGKTHQERITLLNDFKNIYNIRSKILHHGKNRLLGEERSSLARLQKLCEEALEAEANLLIPKHLRPA